MNAIRPDYFGQCVRSEAGIVERIEAASALLCLESPEHLAQALFDAGLRVTWEPPPAPVAALMFCVLCGVAPVIDEDGCCHHCGAEACSLGEMAEHLAAAGLRIERVDGDGRPRALRDAWSAAGSGSD